MRFAASKGTGALFSVNHHHSYSAVLDSQLGKNGSNETRDLTPRGRGGRYRCRVLSTLGSWSFDAQLLRPKNMVQVKPGGFDRPRNPGTILANET